VLVVSHSRKILDCSTLAPYEVLVVSSTTLEIRAGVTLGLLFLVEDADISFARCHHGGFGSLASGSLQTRRSGEVCH
jgi:hypothetical protein